MKEEGHRDEEDAYYEQTCNEIEEKLPLLAAIAGQRDKDCGGRRAGEEPDDEPLVRESILRRTPRHDGAECSDDKQFPQLKSRRAVRGRREWRGMVHGNEPRIVRSAWGIRLLWKLSTSLECLSTIGLKTQIDQLLLNIFYRLGLQRLGDFFDKQVSELVARPL